LPGANPFNLNVPELCPAGIKTVEGSTWSSAGAGFWIATDTPTEPDGTGSVTVPVTLAPVATEEPGREILRGPPRTLKGALSAGGSPGLVATNVYPTPGCDTESPGNQPELTPVHVPEVVPVRTAPDGLFPRLN